ncbi:MAG: thioredoxin family protein [Eubacterium sp.]
MAEKLDSTNFDSFITESELPVLVDFYNDGCIPCRRIAPLISKAEAEYEGRLKFARVNIGMNTELIEKFSVEAAPTLIIFKDGEEVNRHRGATDAEAFKNFIESIL